MNGDIKIGKLLCDEDIITKRQLNQALQLQVKGDKRTLGEILVDKDLRCGCQHKDNGDDWPLDIKGHDGEWYKVYLEPGDMILYESAICPHGRLENFQGTYYRNFFVHYKLV